MDNARVVSPNSTVATNRMLVDLDFRNDPDTFDAVAALLGPRSSCDTLHIPTGLSNAEYYVVTEFMRGFAVATAQLTDATSMPANNFTGLPGQMTAWLRPKLSNIRLFDQPVTSIIADFN